MEAILCVGWVMHKAMRDSCCSRYPETGENMLQKLGLCVHLIDACVRALPLGAE
jgi:hypothetical protein